MMGAIEGRGPAMFGKSADGSQGKWTTARVLVCGNPETTRELLQSLAARGFATNRRGLPGQMACEKCS